MGIGGYLLHVSDISDGHGYASITSDASRLLRVSKKALERI
jgi:hypothetical protein